MLQTTTTMLRAPFVTSTILIAGSILAAPAVASAGVYVGLGIGTTGVSDSGDPSQGSQGTSSSRIPFQDNGRSGRLMLGYRFLPLSFGTFSVEGGYEGFNVERPI